MLCFVQKYLFQIFPSPPPPKRTLRYVNLKNLDLDLIRRIHPECSFYGFMILFWIRSPDVDFPPKKRTLGVSLHLPATFSRIKGTVSRLCARASVIRFSSKDNRTVILTRQDFLPDRTFSKKFFVLFLNNLASNYLRLYGSWQKK